MSAPAGENNPRAKLSDAEVDEMRKMYAEGLWSYTTLADKFGISKSGVADVITGRRRGPNDYADSPVDDLC